MLKLVRAERNELRAAPARHRQVRNVHKGIGEADVKCSKAARDNAKRTVAVSIRAIICDVAVGCAAIERNASLCARDDAHHGVADWLVERQRLRKAIVVATPPSRTRSVKQSVAFGQRVAAVLSDGGLVNVAIEIDPALKHSAQ